MKIFLVLVILVVEKIQKGASQQAWLVPCANNTDCEIVKNATCFNGLCICDGNSYVCEITEMQKANRIGGKCNISKTCNAPNSECQDEICVCKNGFTATQDSNTCLKSLGNQCLSNKDCSFTNNAVCWNSKCSCKVGFVSLDNLECFQIARSIGDICRNDKQCHLAFGNKSDCVDNKCRCKYDYHFKEKTRECVRDLFLGEVCSQSDDCHQPGYETESRLMCLEGECQCEFNYREERGYCIDKNNAYFIKSSFSLPILVANIFIFNYLLR